MTSFAERHGLRDEAATAAAAEVLARVEREGIQLIRLAFPDQHGVLRGKAVTAAAEDPPGPLLSQLKIGGIMVVPVGQSDAVQTLIRVTRMADGFRYDELRQVRFVPLVEGLGQT